MPAMDTGFRRYDESRNRDKPGLLDHFVSKVAAEHNRYRAGLFLQSHDRRRGCSVNRVRRKADQFCRIELEKRRVAVRIAPS
jgi:hypothetical protein